MDPSSVPSNGLLEIKCPYSMAEKDPEDMCKDDNFYCRIINSSLQLDKNHQYYHQVQLKLYVASDKAKWCDFCVFTLKGVCVQHICVDDAWQEQVCPQLDEYFLNTFYLNYSGPNVNQAITFKFFFVYDHQDIISLYHITLYIIIHLSLINYSFITY